MSWNYWKTLGLASALASGHAWAATVPGGFDETVVVEKINAATAFTILPDGRVIYAEQTGFLHVVVDGVSLPEPALDISERLDTYWERGLVGITYDRDFPQSPYLYLVYVAKEPYAHHVVSRFILEGNRVDPNSERILLEGDNQAEIAGRVPAGHQGGPIRHGPDGYLYIGIGEHLNGPASQSLSTLQGKILRIGVDGSIPQDNPFYEQTEGKYRSIFAIGIRNPFGLDFRPGTTRLFESDVGQTSFEEINEIVGGRNYGWPHAEGLSENDEYANPLHTYPAVIGRSICGGIFYPGDGSFPEKWRGKFFFADWAAHWIKAIDVDDPDQLLDFAKDLNAPVWLEAHPDGSLWVLNRGTIWRDGKNFKDNSGSLVRFRFLKEGESVPKREPFPKTLADAGVFRDVAKLVPTKAFIAFEMNAPRWFPNVRQRNWMKVPVGEKIQFSMRDDWVFPEGSILAQHFDNLDGTPQETHVYWSNGDGTYRAAAYRWSSEGTGATFVENGRIEPLSGSAAVNWFSPGPERKLDPKLAVVGFAPQFDTAQLNVGDQIRIWSERSLIDLDPESVSIEDLPKMAAYDDPNAPVDLKVRSYIAANCAVCHQPGGPSRGSFDARFSTPLTEQNLIGGDLMAGNLDIEDARIVVPGEPEKSILYQRLTRKDHFRMPPVSVHGIEPPIVSEIKNWIESLQDE